jgi:hypothetical protein
MAIKFKFGGINFTADTPDEVAQTLALLEKRESEKHQARIQAMLKEGQTKELHEYLKEGPASPWTPELFVSFIDRLGKVQREALALLVLFNHVSDEELRACIKVTGNQALGGILSGISKQAAALGIEARHVFSFENFRNADRRRSTYTVSPGFRDLAGRMNWPNPEQYPYKK